MYIYVFILASYTSRYDIYKQIDSSHTLQAHLDDKLPIRIDKTARMALFNDPDVWCAVRKFTLASARGDKVSAKSHWPLN